DSGPSNPALGQAQKSFQQAAKLSPRDAGNWHNLGKCHQEARQNERAVEAYETALPKRLA
ncbi:MAG TPA: hypothetical protein QF373_07005, partial [Verrucomicrobiota bacterium]|nr:hypothetical protein [Verrucomicrobiota bacterium]